MKIETTRFGSLEIDEAKVIRMPHGMLGFPESRNFVLFPHQKDSPFLWYQSMEDPALAFVVTSPHLILADYTVDIGEAIKRMGWEENGDGGRYELYVIVNIPKGAPEKITVNLIGPILINPASREAMQLVAADSAYSHRFALFQSAVNTGS